MCVDLYDRRVSWSCRFNIVRLIFVCIGKDSQLKQDSVRSCLCNMYVCVMYRKKREVQQFFNVSTIWFTLISGSCHIIMVFYEVQFKFLTELEQKKDCCVFIINSFNELRSYTYFTNSKKTTSEQFMIKKIEKSFRRTTMC